MLWTLIDYYRDGIQRIPYAVDAVEVPLIAAVNGLRHRRGLRPRLLLRYQDRGGQRAFCRKLR